MFDVFLCVNLRNLLLIGHGDWCDHWKQCVWFVPGEGMYVKKDEEVCLHAVHTDISISYSIKSPVSRNKSMQYDLTGRDFKLILPPERIAIYGDSEWRHTMFKAISKAVRIETSLSHHLPKRKNKIKNFHIFDRNCILHRYREELIHYALLQMTVSS